MQSFVRLSGVGHLCLSLDLSWAQSLVLSQFTQGDVFGTFPASQILSAFSTTKAQAALRLKTVPRLRQRAVIYPSENSAD